MGIGGLLKPDKYGEVNWTILRYDRDELNSLMMVDERHLDTELARNSAMVSWINQRLTEAKANYEAAKDKLRVAEAVAFEMYTTATEERKALSATAATKIVEKAPEIVQARAAVREANAEQGFLQRLYETAVQRGNLISQLCKNRVAGTLGGV